MALTRKKSEFIIEADMGDLSKCEVLYMELTLRDFERAAKRLEGIVHQTDLDYSATFSCMAAARSG